MVIDAWEGTGRCFILAFSVRAPTELNVFVVKAVEGSGMIRGDNSDGYC